MRFQMRFIPELQTMSYLLPISSPNVFLYNSLKEVYQKTINQGEIIKCKPLQVDYNRKAV